MEKVISIVIPTYNMESYLRNGLNSLLISNGIERIEVIIVNDGSKDNSLAIANEYVEKFPNVFKVIDKENHKTKMKES